MCGQTGIFLSPKRRNASQREDLMRAFAAAVLTQEPRGPHATGVAGLQADGRHQIAKEATNASLFFHNGGATSVLSKITGRTAALLGHARWATRGKPEDPRNNHPFRCGPIIATHNGTIYNADRLFRLYRLRRYADVDSEILGRVVERSWTGERPDAGLLTTLLAPMSGQLSAAFVSKESPGHLLLLHGNKPLVAAYNRRLGAFLYASTSCSIDAASDATGGGWEPFALPSMTGYVFSRDALENPEAFPITFIRKAPKAKPAKAAASARKRRFAQAGLDLFADGIDEFALTS
ncbi:MAG: glucosamine 6-phosphate synthetase [Sumerlaeia bacterium]